MPMMIDTLLIIAIAFWNLALISVEIGVTQSGFFNTGNDDQIFSDDVIMEVSARSRLACASICEATHGCDAYTFAKGSPVTSSVECRLYSGFRAAGASSLIGARTFVMKISDVDECWSNPCQNDGTCTDQVNGYLCQCAPGYAGLQCQTDVDECSSNPCQNGGTCTDQVNGYLCQCAPGYADLQCQTDVNECSSNPCQNGGTCTDQVNGYLCQCAPGYADLQCQTDVDECSSNPCQNGGTCTDQVNGYLCQCAAGDEGLQCQTAWLKKACSNDEDCPGSLVTCYGGQCLCQPYAYFSDGTNVCVLNCAQSDLRSTFLVYTDMDTTGVSYIDDYDEDDLGQCQTDCVDHSECHAIIHGVGIGSYDSCWRVPSFEAGNTEDKDEWNLYKRTCA